jgi:hypothetical protein
MEGTRRVNEHIARFDLTVRCMTGAGRAGGAN